jgi:undecaprenyl-diphosphatase
VACSTRAPRMLREMDPLVAFVLGVVEGLTEYLPVSSTGHLILTGAALSAADGLASFDIVIQLGAVLAVVVHYRDLLARRVVGLLRRERKSVTLAASLAAGFVPTAVLGLLLRKAIKAYLFKPAPVAAALILGGVAMIAIERMRRARGLVGVEGLEEVTPRRAFVIGLGQCVSLWPGASRSMCTIVAGQLAGLSTATAVEFSFLLALPTLGAATVYEAIKGREELAHLGAANVAVGFVTSFLVAWVVIAGFIRYLKKRGLAPFGYYRVLLGIAVFVVMTR